MTKFFRAVFFLSFILLLAACGTKVKPQPTAEEQLQQAERYTDAGLYDQAITAWEGVRDTFYSPDLSMLAEIKIADIYYTDKRYDEAAVAYEAFIKQYPQDFRIAELLYKQGMSYYNQILSADRDQTSTENALKSFERMNREFPANPHSQEAENLMLRCRTRLADHEVYVGWFYLRTKKYQPAIKRLEAALNGFPDYYYRNEAYYYLIKAYIATDDLDKALETYQKLADQYPHSDETLSARKLLDNLS